MSVDLLEACRDEHKSAALENRETHMLTVFREDVKAMAPAFAAFSPFTDEELETVKDLRIFGVKVRVID